MQEAYNKTVLEMASNIYQRIITEPGLNIRTEILSTVLSHPWFLSSSDIFQIILYGNTLPNFDSMGREVPYKGVELTLYDQAGRIMCRDVSQAMRTLYIEEFER